ncbi:hypothetical protein MBEHAL_1665 [Halarchaeum acidiphilum MH1-52-1]|uniref:Uncharacterized protein n=1 Tax=Halarchaeum acidiphilum MH1-52-1 TaxID=1261545 RepID=U2YV61_9EURY|nr:hypothetical protein MBEHAL_1665 [Halarchaeum acidiphilum MH1-52-1]
MSVRIATRYPSEREVPRGRAIRDAFGASSSREGFALADDPEALARFRL